MDDSECVISTTLVVTDLFTIGLQAVLVASQVFNRGSLVELSSSSLPAPHERMAALMQARFPSIRAACVVSDS